MFWQRLSYRSDFPYGLTYLTPHKAPLVRELESATIVTRNAANLQNIRETLHLGDLAKEKRAWATRDTSYEFGLGEGFECLGVQNCKVELQDC